MADLDSSEASAIAYKTEGNASYQRGDYRHAIYLFSKGLELHPGPEVEHILYSNRSACYCLMEDYARALQDADKVIQMKPEWPKGYTRKGAALQNMRRLEDAAVCYNKAIELEPNNEVAKKGLEDISLAVSQQSKRFISDLSPSTKANLELARKELDQLKDVRWHFEILKDRIWLADPPLTPFRPRSMFIIDIDRKQLLSMTAHPVRDSISLDQLAEFVVNTFLNSGIYPGKIEFSDYVLMAVLAPVFSQYNIQFICDKLSEDKQKFFEEKIEEFEAKEREQWQNNTKFAGVLRQRLQKGMLQVPGITTDFLKHLFSAAAMFYRSKVFLYFSKPMGITTADGVTRVALINRNSLGQYSLAMSTVEASRNPTDSGSQSFMFADPSTIPFDDYDLVERYGWDIAEDKYPLPTVHHTEGEFQHPSLKDLEWYEVAFWTMILFVEETFAKPTFVAPPSLCYSCTIHTSKGPQEVIVTVPPSATPEAPEVQLVSPVPPPPKERLSHMPVSIATRATPKKHSSKKTASKIPESKVQPTAVTGPSAVPASVPLSPPSPSAPPPAPVPALVPAATVPAPSALSQELPSAPPPSTIPTPTVVLTPPGDHPNASASITVPSNAPSSLPASSPPVALGSQSGSIPSSPIAPPSASAAIPTSTMAGPPGLDQATVPATKAPASFIPVPDIDEVPPPQPAPPAPNSRSDPPNSRSATPNHRPDTPSNGPTPQPPFPPRVSHDGTTSPPTTIKHGVQVSYKAEVDAFTGLLAPQEDLLALRRKTAEQERLIQQLVTQIDDCKQQVDMKQQLTQNQKAHIDQLQARMLELEKMNDRLRHDLMQVSKKDQTYSKELLLAFANQSQDLVKALAMVNTDTDNAKAVLEEMGKRSFPVMEQTATPVSRAKTVKDSKPPPSPAPSPTLPFQRAGPGRHLESPPPVTHHKAPSVERNTPPGQSKKKVPGQAQKGSGPTEDGRPTQDIPSAAFMAGPWVGHVNSISKFPQDLSEAEYLSEANVIY